MFKRNELIQLKNVYFHLLFARSIVNNQAKDVLSLNNLSDNLSFDLSSSDDMFAMRELSVIRDKERSREFMNRQKLLFKQFSQRKLSEFKRVKETFNIDSIDIFEQTVDIFKQTIDIAMQQKHVNQMKQSICRDRDRSSKRKRERRENNRDVDNRVARKNARKNARRDVERNAERNVEKNAAADDASNVHMKNVQKFISTHI